VRGLHREEHDADLLHDLAEAVMHDDRVLVQQRLNALFSMRVWVDAREIGADPDVPVVAVDLVAAVHVQRERARGAELPEPNPADLHAQSFRVRTAAQ
jgi:hypothetical protein